MGQLAKLVPGACPVRVPVRVTVKRDSEMSEKTVIEFGTPREVLFASSLSLEFADEVWLENSDGSFKAQARVVAAQYHVGKLAVAARFCRDVSNWIIKP